MKKLTLNYQGTFIKELQIASYIIAGLGIIAAVVILLSLESGYFKDEEANTLKWVYALSVLVGSISTAIFGLVLAGIAKSALIQRVKAEVDLYKMGYEPEDDSFFLSSESMNELISAK